MQVPPLDDQGFAKQWGKVVAQAWFDPDFKRRLLSDPVGVMRERGMAVPADARVKLHDQEAAVSGSAPRDELEVLSRWTTHGQVEARELTLLLPPRPRADSSDSLSRDVHLGPLGYPEKMSATVWSGPSPKPEDAPKPGTPPRPQPEPRPHPEPRPPSDPKK